MPALPVRRSNKPFKPQRELKNPRTHAKLRTYAKRRASYNASAALVLCMFIVHYLPEIREWRAERQRIAMRPRNKARQRKHRKLVSLLARITRLQEHRVQLATEIAVVEERIRVKVMHLRRRATTQAGFSAGWLAAPTDSAPTKEDNWSTRYRVAWEQAHSERQRVEAKMQKQQTPVVQPRTIQL